MKRNYSLDILKLYFAITIAISHAPFGTSFPVINSGWIVLMFFILSGFFMVSSFDSGKYSDAWHYSLNRAAKIYPHYLLAFVIQYFYMYLQIDPRPRALVLNFLRSMPELFMLSGTGAFAEPLNYPVWHLCCLVVASHILFALLEWNRKAALNVVCPTVVLLAFTYLGLEDAEIWGMLGNFLYLPMLRAFSGIALGMFLHDPIRSLLHKLERSTVAAMPGLISVLTVLLFVILWANRQTQELVIPYAGILVCLLYSKSIFAKIFRHPALSGLNTLSLSIFVHHALIVRLFENHAHLYEDLPVQPDILFLLVLIPYCMVMTWVADRVAAGLKRLFQRLPKTETQSL